LPLHGTPQKLPLCAGAAAAAVVVLLLLLLVLVLLLLPVSHSCGCSHLNLPRVHWHLRQQQK
jgi:hypothetical protein